MPSWRLTTSLTRVNVGCCAVFVMVQTALFPSAMVTESASKSAAPVHDQSEAS